MLLLLFLLLDYIFLNLQQGGYGLFTNIKNDRNYSAFEIQVSVSENGTKLLLDHCELEELDPWHPSLQQFLNPQSNPMKNCKPITKQISKLKNGQLFLYFQEENLKHNECKRRCLLPDSDYSIIFGEWIVVQNGTRPECDIFEIKCYQIVNGIAVKEPFYKFLHSQIYPSNSLPKNNKTANKKNDFQKPDVHLIILDSVSQSQFLRSMPKTRRLLQEYYQAIPFRHLNKIGLNSFPNAFGLLFGKQVYSFAKSGLSQGYEYDYANESYCSDYLDNDQFIGYRFQDDGYQTMMSEDWPFMSFDYTDCKGFKTKPTYHYPSIVKKCFK